MSDSKEIRVPGASAIGIFALNNEVVELHEGGEEIETMFLFHYNEEKKLFIAEPTVSFWNQYAEDFEINDQPENGQWFEMDVDLIFHLFHQYLELMESVQYSVQNLGVNLVNEADSILNSFISSVRDNPEKLTFGFDIQMFEDHFIFNIWLAPRNDNNTIDVISEHTYFHYTTLEEDDGEDNPQEAPEEEKEDTPKKKSGVMTLGSLLREKLGYN